ncbi:hypothetical protein LSH36_344g02022, partial [Paralvinella palmiformis]
GHSSEDPSANQTPVFIRRKETPDHVQDDTVIYQNRQQEHSVRKPKRRGASFNLRSANNRPTSWQSPGDDCSSAANPMSNGSRSSMLSADNSASNNKRDVSGECYPRQQKLNVMKSSPNLQNYLREDEEMNFTAVPPGSIPSSQSWHSMSGLVGGGHKSACAMNSGDHYRGQPHVMRKSYSYSNSPGRSFSQNDNHESQPFRKSYSESENWDNSLTRSGDIHHSYSASYSGTSKPVSSHVRHLQSQDYENVDMMTYKSGYKDNISVNCDSSRYGSHQTGDNIYVSDGSRMNEVLEESHTSERSHTTDNCYQRPVSPPVPPARDASSLHFGKVSRNHEKYPSWPVTETNFSSRPSCRGDMGSSGTNGVRTNSWSDTSRSNQEFPNKPRMAYQPQLNTHVEERMSPQTMKKYFEENRLKTKKEQFDEHVASELEGEDLDIKQKFPLDKRGKIDISNVRGSDLSYPLPKLDRDGRYMEDKNYAIPSPPQRDGSPIRKRSVDGPFASCQSATDQLHSTTQGIHHRECTPPPPLPDNSPSCVPQAPFGNNVGTSSSSSSHYPYIIRQRAFYNTSTQTDVKNAEVQVEDVNFNNGAGVKREEKCVQARPGSIVGHFEKQQQLQLQKEQNSDYERLIFNRDSSHSMNTRDAGTSPGPSSPQDEAKFEQKDNVEYRHLKQNVMMSKMTIET